MKNQLHIGFLVMTLLCVASTALTIVPAPKEISDTSQSWIITGSDNCAIVLGTSASGPEQYAAGQFQTWMKRRFGKTMDTLRENASLTMYAYLFVFGTRASNEMLNQLATANSLNLSATSPGKDGYVISMVTSGGQNIALVGGSDQRGVIYGQNTLFQLFEKTGSSLTLRHASIRDWPSVNSRTSWGPMVFDPQLWINPNYMDAFMMGRLNTMDIHWGVCGDEESAIPDGWASQFMDGYKNKRGCFVWGSFNARVSSASEITTKIGYWNKYLNQYHVDGIWANLDDGGSASYSYALLDTFVKWGRAHGLADTHMMFLPPQPEYETPAAQGNRTFVDSVPALKDISWIFTASPGPECVANAAALGLVHKPLWWNNMPCNGWKDPDNSGYYSYGFSWTVDAQDSVYYMEMLGPQDGWACYWGPYYTCTLEGYEAEPWISMGDYTPAMMRWGHRYYVQQEYITMLQGLWAWNPADYSFKKTSMHIYKTIFGEERAPCVAVFDSCLFTLKTGGYFTPSGSRPWPLQGNRVQAEAMAQTMCECVANIKNNPVTVLDSAWYTNKYVKGMENVVRVLYGYLGNTYTACEPTMHMDNTIVSAQVMQMALFPNPFNPAVSVHYDLGSRDKHATMEIFDLGGRLVKSYALTQAQGSVSWTGQDQQGRSAASGIYIIRLRAANVVLEKTAILLK